MMKYLATFVKRYPVITGFALMFALTWPIDLAAAAESHGRLPFHVPFIASMLVGYGFVVASLLLTGITGGKAGIRALLKRFLIWRVGWRWYAVVLLGPLGVGLVALGVPFVVAGTTPDWDQTMAHELAGPFSVWLFLPVFFLLDLTMNGEEIGWRGYLLPRLQSRYGAVVASMIIGLAWAAWHIPKYLREGATLPPSATLYVVEMLALAMLYTWISNNTRGSLLLVTLLHAAKNTIVVALLPQTGVYVVISAVLTVMLALIVVLLSRPSFVRSQEISLAYIPDSVVSRYQ